MYIQFGYPYIRSGFSSNFGLKLVKTITKYLLKQCLIFSQTKSLPNQTIFNCIANSISIQLPIISITIAIPNFHEL